MPGKSGFAVPIRSTDDLATIQAKIAAVGARDWFEGVQVPPRRVYTDGEPIPQPTMRPGIQILEVREVHPAARSVTEANTEFGAGGTNQVFVPGNAADRLSGQSVFDDRDRFRERATIELDPKTMPGRVEDPMFKAVDPTLPDTPLDPRHERNVGRAQGAATGAAAGATDTESPGATP